MHDNEHEIISAFYNFLAEHGHPLDNNINHDSSRFHYYKCPHGSTTDARYKFFYDTIPSGYFKCWHCNIEAGFCSKKKHEVAASEWQTYAERMTEYKRQNEIEAQQKHAEVAILAKEVFLRASNDNVSKHPYLRLKHVVSFGLRVVIDEDEITQKAKCYKGTLLIPCYYDGEMVNVERIYFGKKENKFQKRPLIGGQRIGVYYPIGEITEQQETIYISEGYSTAATVYEAVNRPTVVAFNCGNLPHTAQEIRKLHPNAKIIIAADRDSTKAGEQYAIKAIKHSGGRVCLPNFSEIPRELKPDIGRSDFNDLFQLLIASGLNRTAALEKVRQQIQNNLNSKEG